jgi:hypothetical protein
MCEPTHESCDTTVRLLLRDMQYLNNVLPNELISNTIWHLYNCDKQIVVLGILYFTSICPSRPSRDVKFELASYSTCSHQNCYHV